MSRGLIGFCVPGWCLANASRTCHLLPRTRVGLVATDVSFFVSLGVGFCVGCPEVGRFVGGWSGCLSVWWSVWLVVLSRLVSDSLWSGFGDLFIELILSYLQPFYPA